MAIAAQAPFRCGCSAADDCKRGTAPSIKAFRVIQIGGKYIFVFAAQRCAAAAPQFRAGCPRDFCSPSMGVGCENNSFSMFADVGAVLHLADVVALSDAGEAGVVDLPYTQQARCQAFE